MNITRLILIQIFCLLTIKIISQTVVPGGFVSGFWNAEFGPYYIDGDITLHADSSLAIHEGVEIIFRGHYAFNVYGYLNAVGTPEDSIIFTSQDTIAGWHGLRLFEIVQALPDSMRIWYCRFEYGKSDESGEKGGGVYAENSTKIDIRHCMVKNCSADIGGGIYLKNSPIHFNQLTVEDNYSNKGGGMYCHYSDAVIKNSKVIDNTGAVCGGVYFYHSSAIITNCVISNNMSHAGGGGVVIHKASHANFMNCKIEHNMAVGSGGGVAILEGSLPVFKYCHISYNTTQYQEYQAKGAGFFITSYDNSPVIINCFISGNICDEEGGGFYSESKLQLIDCLISNNVASVSQGFGGGGMYTMFNQNLVLNCTFSGNQAPQGSTIYSAGSMTEMYNTIIWWDVMNINMGFLHH